MLSYMDKKFAMKNFLRKTKEKNFALKFSDFIEKKILFDFSFN